jgi:protein-disulfide isomerase-like protein with CxxC motif
MRQAEQILIERRVNRRFYLEGRLMNADASVCAHILNIGMGGVAFRYVAEEAWSTDPSEPAILFGEQFYLAGIPLIIISEFVQHNGIYTIRRQGARFGELSAEQISRLEQIITDHAG